MTSTIESLPATLRPAAYALRFEILATVTVADEQWEALTDEHDDIWRASHGLEWGAPTDGYPDTIGPHTSAADRSCFAALPAEIATVQARREREAAGADAVACRLVLAAGE
jgi:hypothetical protein